MEEALTDVMYDIPSRKNVEKCILGRDAILSGGEPTLILNETKKALPPKKKKPTENIDSAS
jgi:ATP-dependent Clp protease ATP-binding subunit ClpX